MSKQKAWGLAFVVMAFTLILAACGAQPAAPATMAPAPTTAATAAATDSATAAPTAAVAESPLQPGAAVSPLQPTAPQSYAPISDEACEALRTSVATALDAEASVETAGFRDYAANVTGQGCMITLRGTGADFPSFVEVAQQLEALLTEQGFELDQAFAADSPTGTLFGLRKGSDLALVDVGWMPVASANCPADQPISSCNLQPEQQNYTITVNVATAQ